MEKSYKNFDSYFFIVSPLFTRHNTFEKEDILAEKNKSRYNNLNIKKKN